MVNTMNEARRNDEIELDIGKILKALVRRRLWMLVSAAVGTAAAFLLALLVTPRYSSTVTFFVKNDARADAGKSITSADIAASKELVESCLVILQAEETLDAVIYSAQVYKTPEQVRRMIRASAVNSTEFFSVEVTGTDPREAEAIANAIGYVLPMRVVGILENSTVRIVDAALLPFDPSEPGYGTVTAVGFALGLCLSLMATVVYGVLDKTVRSPRDVERTCGLPVLVQTRQEDAPSSRSVRALASRICLTFPEGSHILALTGTGGGEDRSALVWNLACCLRRRGKRVLLVDCDLNHSRLSRRLEGRTSPGLSEFLTGEVPLKEIFRACRCPDCDVSFPVVPAGKKQPERGELLVSKRMQAALRAFRNCSQLVILDVPSLKELSEGAELAKEADGVLLAVCQDKSSTEHLGESVAHLEFAGANLMGIVYISNSGTEK